VADNHSCNKCQHARARTWRTIGIRWPLCLSDPDQWACNSPQEQEKTRSRVTGKTRRDRLTSCRDKTCNEPCDEWESKSKARRPDPGDWF
jgi:hypothetical protein